MAFPMGGGGSGGSSSSGSGRGGRVVGDYIFGRQIGAGSFSVVWHARHRIHGTEVAVKEIVLERLSKKLQESLMSEIVILKNVNHPNIISLHDIIEMKTSARIFLILEYCRGGDLSIYIQRHGRVPEVTAKHFMQQLACGLQVLRENNLIHRDLKPQNLLLSRNDDTAVLKIADFGFARSLQPRGLAETLCGSPLYMAPEIMQLQKYDAKADLWSVGAILFQLVTGKTPFTGNNQIQLLQNIIKSTELRFPPGNSDLSSDCIDLCQKLLRRNPVERLTFEEFFNHPFLSENYSKRSLSCSTSSRAIDESMTKSNLARAPDVNSLEDCLPFILDDVTEAHNVKQEGIAKNSPMRSTYGFSVGAGVDKTVSDKPSKKVDSFSRNTFTDKLDCTTSKIWQKSAVGSPKGSKLSIEQQPIKISSEGPSVVDSLEFVEQDYVLVSGPPLEVSSSSITASRPCNSPCESDSQPRSSPKECAVSIPMPIIGATGKTCGSAMMESPRCSPPSGTSQGSMDMADAIEEPSSDCMTRIRSLQQCGSALTELVKEKVGSGRMLEAFSVQLVILAIWKQALHICHAQAASAVEGSPSQEIKVRGSLNKNETFDSDESHNASRCQQPDAAHIERAFLLEVGIAEELARELGPVDEAAEMPDAMEIIFQFALTLGRGGAADELINNMESATALYSNAVRLLYFILVEAPSLILNPPFSLTTSDRFRLRSYIDTLKNRQSQYRSQRMAFLGVQEQQSL